MKAIDWQSPENHLLLNPRLPAEARSKFERAWHNFIEGRIAGQIGIATSGSSGDGFGRLIVLSKEAVLTSAKAVNERLESTREDIWFRTLPLFHVGGIGILARAHLTGAAVVEDASERWDPEAFHKHLSLAEATQLSLVPTHLFDLVQKRLRAPPTLRKVVIGGGRLSEELRVLSLELGWPVLPSYGMTECCSQIATALHPEDPRLMPLSHVKVRLSADDRLEVGSPSLLRAQIVFDNHGSPSLIDPKHDGWFTTEDIASIGPTGELKILGRKGDFVKIGGEGVVVSRLEGILDTLKVEMRVDADVALMAATDERLGAKIVLLSTVPGTLTEELVDRFNEKVLPFEAIRSVHEVDVIPRSALGKLLRIPALALVGLEAPANL